MSDVLLTLEEVDEIMNALCSPSLDRDLLMMQAVARVVDSRLEAVRIAAEESMKVELGRIRQNWVMVRPAVETAAVNEMWTRWDPRMLSLAWLKVVLG